MTHASLFTGFGGFDIAAEWMGWDNLFQCEIEPYCQQLLKYYWPQVTLYNNATTADYTIWRGKIDVLSGGFPCQPFSHAGKRKGTEDNRYLWPANFRAIREIKPRWYVGENVYGLVNWSKGMVFEQVQVDLENEGYEVQPYILPACGKNAPHRRNRIWFVAHAKSSGLYGHVGLIKSGQQETNSQNKKKEWERIWDDIGRNVPETIVAIPEEIRCKQYGSSWNGGPRFKDDTWINNWEKFPTQSPIFSRNDGLPNKLVNYSLSSYRRKSIEGYGNAIVPQLAYHIFKTIETYELIDKNQVDK